ncbi:UNVERIFIED_CONTAM: hypothetical protein K2H54_007542 [Gekko kuhli]
MADLFVTKWCWSTINRASLWSSCVVLPLLALTWMSAVLAITDRRSALFQILFAVFDSLEGFVIVMVHCILRREVGTLRVYRYKMPSNVEWWTAKKKEMAILGGHFRMDMLS